jgi:hypothetical protein
MVPAPHRAFAPSSTVLPIARAVVAFAALAIVLLSTSAGHAAAPRQTGPALFLPDLQTDVKAGEGGFSTIQGQEGFGNSVVEVQNVSDVATSLTLDLFSKTGSAPVNTRRSLAARGSTRVDMANLREATGGFYSGRLTAGQPLGGATRLRWVSGAAVAYEAAPAARQFILPLIARTVYSHTTYIYAQNTDQGSSSNGVTMTIYDREDGTYMVESGINLDADETYNWDTAQTDNTFGPGTLGVNAPTGGWIGHAWLEGGRDFAVLAYGDELTAQGSSAYLARPISAGATTQYLPLVRANNGGDSLIAIANATMKAVNATILYHGASFSPSGANQDFSQTVTISPRGAVFVDLSERGRGSRPAPDLPRGASAGAGFIGSATITASGPILAVAQDEQLAGGKVSSVSAYNAFGPADLGTEFSAVTVRKAVDYQSSVLYVHNPAFGPLELTVDLFDAADARAGSVTKQVPAGGLSRIALNDVAAFPDGLGRAMLSGSGPFTALVADERDARGTPEVLRQRVYLRGLGDGIVRVNGAAILTEQGADLAVAIEISPTFPGSTYAAQIRRGECPSASAVAHSLGTFTDGKSNTVLRNVNLAALTASPHVIMIASSNPRTGSRDVSCGAIEPPAGAEVVDTTLSWPVRMTVGEAIPTPTATPSEPTPTIPPTAPATATPSATTAPDNRLHVYLPLAHR